ncbi:hypothetical protein RYX36_012134 [Vicia faba]
MISRGNQGKCSRYAAGSSSQSRQSVEFEHLEFDNTRFIGTCQQARFYSLAERQIWLENIFTLNPQGDYRYFVDDMERRKWGVLLTPMTELNFDIIQEFYANAISIEDVASKKWRLDLVSETLALTLNHGFFLNASNQPVHFKRRDMNTKSQLKAGVDIPNVATKRISSIVNDDYVLRHYVLKLASEAAPQP